MGRDVDDGDALPVVDVAQVLGVSANTQQAQPPCQHTLGMAESCPFKRVRTRTVRSKSIPFSVFADAGFSFY